MIIDDRYRDMLSALSVWRAEIPLMFCHTFALTCSVRSPSSVLVCGTARARVSQAFALVLPASGPVL